LRLHPLRLQLGAAHGLVARLDLFHQLQLGIFLDREPLLHVLDLGRELGQFGRVVGAPAHQVAVPVPHPGAMALDLALAVAQALGGFALGRSRLLQPRPRLFQPRVAGQSGLQVLDLGAEVLDALVHAGVAQQQLAGVQSGAEPIYSITARTWPSLTTSCSLTRISLTVPATGATTGISIFMDSRITRMSSSSTVSPGLASTFQTLPTSSALTSVGI